MQSVQPSRNVNRRDALRLAGIAGAVLPTYQPAKK